MKRLTRMLATAALTAWTARGAEPAPEAVEGPALEAPPAAEQPAATNVQAEAAAKTDLEVLRDPFWPIGYTPAPAPDADVAEGPQMSYLDELKSRIRWPALRLKGVTRVGDRHLAIIDEVGLVEAGDTITLRRGELVYSWQIEDVTGKGVAFKRLDASPYRAPAPAGPRTQ